MIAFIKNDALPVNPRQSASKILVAMQSFRDYISPRAIYFNSSIDPSPNIPNDRVPVHSLSDLHLFWAFALNLSNVDKM